MEIISGHTADTVDICPLDVRRCPLGVSWFLGTPRHPDSPSGQPYSVGVRWILKKVEIKSGYLADTQTTIGHTVDTIGDPEDIYSGHMYAGCPLGIRWVVYKWNYGA